MERVFRRNCRKLLLVADLGAARAAALGLSRLHTHTGRHRSAFFLCRGVQSDSVGAQIVREAVEPVALLDDNRPGLRPRAGRSLRHEVSSEDEARPIADGVG